MKTSKRNTDIKLYTLRMNDWMKICEYQLEKYGHMNFTTAASYNMYDEMKANEMK